MTEPPNIGDAPHLVEQLLRDIMRRLDAGNDRMGGIEKALSKVEFELARTREQVTIANGRTTKIEDRLNRVDIDEIPALRNAFLTRIEQVEGDVEAVMRQRADDAAEMRGREKQRADDRAKFRFVWEFVGKEMWKYLTGAATVGIGILIARLFGWVN